MALYKFTYLLTYLPPFQGAHLLTQPRTEFLDHRTVTIPLKICPSLCPSEIDVKCNTPELMSMLQTVLEFGLGLESGLKSIFAGLGLGLELRKICNQVHSQFSLHIGSFV